MNDLDTRAHAALVRLVAEGKIRSAWLPGMHAVGPAAPHLVRAGRATTALYRGQVISLGPREAQVLVGRDEVMLISPYLPDLSDPLTVMGLLLLAREACGDPRLSVRCVRDRWIVSMGHDGYAHHDAATEAAAILAALEAA